MKRRMLVAACLQGVLWGAALMPVRVRAQRVTQPIYRPTRPGRPDRVIRPGRLDAGVVNYGAAAGAYTVAAVRERDGIVRLRDDDGNAADVFVSARLFDISTLKSGDVVAVDFFVGGDDDRLEAASIEKLEVISQ